MFTDVNFIEKMIVTQECVSLLFLFTPKNSISFSDNAGCYSRGHINNFRRANCNLDCSGKFGIRKLEFYGTTLEFIKNCTPAVNECFQTCP